MKSYILTAIAIVMVVSLVALFVSVFGKLLIATY